MVAIVLKTIHYNLISGVQRKSACYVALSDSADHWLHLCPFRGLRMIRDSVLSALQTAVSDFRYQGPLKKQLIFAFLSLLKATDKPNSLWTANWSQQQTAVLASSFDGSLLRGLKVRNLTAILPFLEEILAQVALSL